MLSTRPSSEVGECDPPADQPTAKLKQRCIDVKAEGNLANLANFSL